MLVDRLRRPAGCSADADVLRGGHGGRLRAVPPARRGRGRARGRAWAAASTPRTSRRRWPAPSRPSTSITSSTSATRSPRSPPRRPASSSRACAWSCGERRPEALDVIADSLPRARGRASCRRVRGRVACRRRSTEGRGVDRPAHARAARTARVTLGPAGPAPGAERARGRAAARGAVERPACPCRRRRSSAASRDARGRAASTSSACADGRARAARRRAQPGGRADAGRVPPRGVPGGRCRSSSAPCATRTTPACSGTCCRAPRSWSSRSPPTPRAADARRAARLGLGDAVPARRWSSSRSRWPRWTRLGVGAAHLPWRARSSCSGAVLAGSRKPRR